MLPQYPHKCGLTRKCRYLGQYTRIIPAFLTKKNSITTAFSTKKNPQRQKINIYRVSDLSCHPQIPPNIPMCQNPEKKVLNWPPSEVTRSRTCHLQKMCQNPEEKNKVLNWPPSEVTRSRTCHPKKMAKSSICHPQKMAVSNTGEFRGGKFWSLPFFGGGKSWTWLFQDSVIFLESGTQGNLGVARRIRHPVYPLFQ